MVKSRNGGISGVSNSDIKQWPIKGTVQIKEQGYQRSKEPGYAPQIAPPAVRIPFFEQMAVKKACNIIYGRKNTVNIIYVYIYLYAYTSSSLN